MQHRRRSKTPKQNLRVLGKNQTDLSAWRKEGKADPPESEQNGQSPHSQEGDSKEDYLEHALSYLEKVQGRVSLKKSSALQKHLSTVESIALERGLPPEAFDVLLKVALSGKLAITVNTCILKSLIPASVIPEDSVVSAVSWLCVDKCSDNIQLLFIKWLITVFDFIDHKEQINALYGCFFLFLQYEKMCPYVCHLLYLLTRKENVKPFRVRKLLDLQSKMGMQPHLQALLSLYKLFCPELVTIALPGKRKTFFKSADGPWKAAINTIRRRNQQNSPVSQLLPLGTAQLPSRKRKWNNQLTLPATSANLSFLKKDGENCDSYSTNETFPVEQLQSFPQLLENIHRLEFPSQMGSVLANPLLLHYMNFAKDECVDLRLYYWMSQALQEECAWYVTDKEQHEEFKEFLETIYKSECLLQDGFPSCEEFLYKNLPLWDGFSCQSQILRLLTWIPLSSFSEMKSHLCDPLAQLFFTSSVYFKCSVLESLKELLQNWLICHAAQLDSESEASQAPSLNTTLSGHVNMVAELVDFAGWMSTAALHLENNSSLLMYFILDFYETVCDMYLSYDLPLLILPPAGVFYPALLSIDSVNLNQLCRIMYRYRANLVAAKENEQSKKKILPFKFSGKTYQVYNQYLTAIVGCLWTSNVFQKDTHPQGLVMDDELLKMTAVQEFKKSFNIVYHPALMGFALNFMKQAWPDDMIFDFSLIKGKRWNWYLEYLYAQGLTGLKDLIESSISRVSQTSQNKAEGVQV